MPEVSESRAHLPPSAKQVKFLDGLAGKLGYPNGKAFARDLYGADQYGAIKWDRESVSTAIDNAQTRVNRQRELARKLQSSKGPGGRAQRTQAGPDATQGNPSTKGG
jgi:hypothetical protein